MSTLTDIQPQAEHKPPAELPETYAAALGPYPKSYDVQIVAYVRHFDGGDDSTADMKLLYDGGQVGEKSDRSFSETLLEIPYSFYLTRGSVAELAIVTENHKATVGTHGFHITASEAADQD